MDADGSGQTSLTDESGLDLFPDWSHDGTKIAFGSDRDGGSFEVYIMDAEGSNQTRLTCNAGVDLFPDWSPGLVPDGIVPPVC